MKNALFLLLAAAILATNGCAQKVDLEAEKTKVKSVVDQFGQFWETENMELLSKIMAHDADIVLFGSDAPEHWVGWESFKKSAGEMLHALESIKINVRDQVIKVHPCGQIAWFSQLWDWSFTMEGQQVQIPNQRFTGVLENRKGKWVFVQFHNSVPVVSPSQ